MNLFRPLSRAVILSTLLLGAAGATPALAAPADVALLQSYVGDWRGRGTLEGANSESVVCRLSLNPGNEGKVNYSGRCTLAGRNLAINGTLAYVEAARRYEAAMTSNATFTGLAVGQKRGNDVVFNLREREEDDEGKDFTISAQIVLAGTIDVSFDIVYAETGDNIRAAVSMSR